MDFQGTIYNGEHEAIIDTDTWQQVQETLRRNGRSGGKRVRNKYGAMLKGLLYCTPCGTGMAHTYTSRKRKIYRYYVCLNDQQRGWKSCPSKSINAHEIETAVVDHIRGIGRNKTIIAATAARVCQESDRLMSKLEAEQRRGKRELRRLNEKVQKLVRGSFSKGSGKEPAIDQLADLQDRIRTLEQRMTAVREQLISTQRQTVDENDLRNALGAFDPVWESPWRRGINPESSGSSSNASDTTDGMEGSPSPSTRRALFKFIHAADVHLDSPLRGLSKYESAPAEALRNACRKAFENLIDLAIEEKVAFVLLAGDLYDGERMSIADEVASSEGRPVAMRIRFEGATAISNELAAYPERFEQRIKALDAEIAGDDLWIEKVEISTASKLDLDTVLAEGSAFGQLLEGILATPSKPEDISGLKDVVAGVRQKIPSEAFGDDSQFNLDEPETLERLVDEAKQMLAGRLLAAGGSK